MKKTTRVKSFEAVAKAIMDMRYNPTARECRMLQGFAREIAISHSNKMIKQNKNITDEDYFICLPMRTQEQKQESYI